jgi:hypothetical protein
MLADSGERDPGVLCTMARDRLKLTLTQGEVGGNSVFA